MQNEDIRRQQAMMQSDVGQPSFTAFAHIAPKTQAAIVAMPTPARALPRAA